MKQEPIIKDIQVAEVHPELPQTDIDELVANFNLSEHEPPVVIGHAENDNLVTTYSEIGDQQRTTLMALDNNRPKIIEFGETPGTQGDGPRNNDEKMKLRPGEVGIINLSEADEKKYGGSVHVTTN